MNELEQIEEEIKKKLEEAQNMFELEEADHETLALMCGSISAYLYVLSMINKLKGD